MSYISKQYLLCSNTNVANFNAWGSSVSAAIAAMGWTKTADTGQVSWGSVVVGSVYEVWHPNDALQTGPSSFYMRVQYGTSGTNVNISFSLGTATNGAGTLTGQVVGPFFSYGGNADTAVYECDFCGDSGRLGMFLWRNCTINPYAPTLVMVERLKNADGSDASSGVTLVVSSANNTNGFMQQTILFGLGNGPQTYGNTISPGSVSSGAFNGSVPVSPLFPGIGKYASPHTSLLVMGKADCVEGLQVNVELYSTTHTYLCSAKFLSRPKWFLWCCVEV